MTNTLTTLEAMDKEIKKYQTVYRKYRKDSFRWEEDKKVRFSQNKEDKNSKDVQIRTSNYGCFITYTLNEKELIVKEFSSRGGILGEFDKLYAEEGLYFLFGLAEFLNLESIKISTWQSENKHEFFRKYGFSSEYNEDTGKTDYTLDFYNGVFHTIRPMFDKVTTILNGLKKENDALKFEFLNFSNRKDYLRYTFSYYVSGIKGEFCLGIDGKGIHFKEKELNISEYTQQTCTFEETVNNFLVKIKEYAKTNSLVTPSDIIFKEVAPRLFPQIVAKDKSFSNKIFKELSNRYTQEELDKGLKYCAKHARDCSEKDFDYQSYAISYNLILDVIIMTVSNTEFKIFTRDQMEVAKVEYAKHAASAYYKETKERLDYLCENLQGTEEK